MNKKSQLFKYLLIFLTVFIMCRANLFGSIYPFGISYSFALVSSGINAIIVAIYYFLSTSLLNFNIYTIITNLVAAVSLSLIYFFQKFTNKKLPVYILSIIMILGQSAYIYFNVYSPETLINVTVSLLVTFISFYIFEVSLNALKQRGSKFKFTIDEKICHAIILMAVYAGVSKLYICNFNLSYCICCMILFFISRITSNNITICLSTIAGLGMSLTTLSVVPIAIFSIWSFVFITFANNNRIITSIILIAADVVMGCFLNTYGSYDFIVMLPVVLASLIIILVPKKTLNYLSNFINNKNNIIDRYLRLISRNELKQKILNVSNVFSDMESIYKTLLIGPIDKDSSVNLIANEVVKKTCNYCENYKKCHMGKLDIISSFCVMVHAGVYRGKISALDAPSLILTECNKIQLVVSNINSTISSFNCLVEETKEADKSNMQVANQLGATSFLLSEMARKYNEDVWIDKIKSVDIYEEMIYHDLSVSDVACMYKKNGVHSILIAIENRDVLSPYVLFSIQKILGIRCSIVERKMCEISGYTLIIVKPEGKFEIVYGVSCRAKENGTDSGDSFTVNKINDSKYLYAICDGKGSGQKAFNISSKTISLIENFYKAGFESNIIIESVNKLLLPSGDENFSCLDAVVVDQNTGRVDFIKIGASVSIVKSKNTSNIIECKSLPLGIIEHITPAMQSLYMEDNDVIVLASDGVVDSFSSPESFSDYINNERINNPNIFSETVLEEAAARNKDKRDDMTVLVIKLLRK